jgi:hypothetical protein
VPAAAAVWAQENLESHCPYHEDVAPTELKSSPSEGPELEKLGIRFSHASAMTPGEMQEMLPARKQSPAKAMSDTTFWEMVQLSILVVSLGVVVWIAYRKLS